MINVTILIPAYNESATIIELLETVASQQLEGFALEVLVIDDGSTDGTGDLLDARPDLYTRLIKRTENGGKGAAVVNGLAEATGDYILFQDADLEYDPNEYSTLISPIISNRADVVFGSRFRGGKETRVCYFWHRMGNGFLTFLSNMFTNLNLTDMETCYKVFRREIIQSIVIEEDRFGMEPEITAKISKLNCRIYEVGISYYGRTYEEGKKIGWKDGVRAIYCILKYNLFR